VPPPLIWQGTLDRIRNMMARALEYDLPALSQQRTWTEVPFGATGFTDAGEHAEDAPVADPPWPLDAPVRIPGTDVLVRGQIDRLDLSGDRRVARVIDYKTGKLNKKMDSITIDGGRELQRCLYAFAVRTLVGETVAIEAGLLFPVAPAGEDAWFPLGEVDATLASVSTAIKRSQDAVVSGIALPGIDAGSDYNEHRFALPASATYLARKYPLAKATLGEAAAVWEEA
jgi:hypothetical protein